MAKGGLRLQRLVQGHISHQNLNPSPSFVLPISVAKTKPSAGSKGLYELAMALAMRDFFTETEMSLIPLLYRDWWEDFERPSRLLDQNFGLGLRRDDLINTLFNSSLLRHGYSRPWRDLVRQNSGSSTLQMDKDKFQVILDVQQFAPNEITVKTVNNTVVVEGKHEEKQDEHGFISRHFVRKYILPQDIEPLNITSNLSSDGVLTITAPKKVIPAIDGERVVPIKQTGVPAARNHPVTPASDTTASPAPETPTTPTK